MIKRWFALGIMLNTALLTVGCAPAMVGGAAATATVAHDRRTTGSVVEDQAIEMRITNRLRETGISKQVHVNVTSYNGIVLLSGEAPGEDLLRRIGDIARETEKVRRVHNEIKLAAPSSMMTRSSDTLITSKVKTALLKVETGYFDPTRVKVVTENGTVYLMGLLSRSEAATVTARVQNVGGVQRIVKLFEYQD